MDIKSIEKKLVNNYLRTLGRYKINNIPINKYVKKPYIEQYIIDMANENNESEIINKIDLIIEDIDTNDFCMYIYDNIDITSNEKKIIQKNILDSNNDNNKYELIKNILLFIINYYQYYMIITELLYDNDELLYIDIYNYIKNDSNKNKNNLNFQILNYYSNNLYEKYIFLINIFIKNKLLDKNEYNELKIKNLFFKNLFSNWYLLYKKNIDNGINIKQDEEVKKEKKLLSRLLCINNIY